MAIAKTRINVVKPFNLLLPDGKLIKFEPGLQEVGTYQKPIWPTWAQVVKGQAQDAATGEFEEKSIADHPWVKAHVGKMPTREELLAEANRLKEEADALARAAEAAADGSVPVVEGEAIAAPEPAQAASSGAMRPNTRVKSGEVRPNTRA